MDRSGSKLKDAAARLRAADASGCLEVCNDLLGKNPGLIAALHLRGLAAAQLDKKELAVADLSSVWSVQQNNLQAALVLGSLLRQGGRYEEAIPPLEAASRQPEFEVDARYELARVLTRLRRAEEAMGQYRQVLQSMPQHADAAANLAFLLERANHLDESGQWADRALAVMPGNVMARLAKAIIDRRMGALESAQERLQALLGDDLGPLNRSIAFNQLGQCHEQAAAWPEALRSYRASNQVLRTHHPHGIPVENGSYGLDTVRDIHRWLVANPPVSWSPNTSHEPSDPTFLVGFPRSGTTLLDQALSAHPEVEVLEEYEFLDEVRRHWVENNHLSRISSMTLEEIRAARKLYLVELKSRRKFPHRRVVIDKLPLNLVYLFLVHRLFPASRILFMQRDPRDACLSCYFQSFDLQGAMPYFLDLHDTANYYHRVMSLAVDTLRLIGNPQTTVCYEELVTGFEPTMRKVIDFLGLEWAAGVLDYRDNSRRRMIHTPSYQQVIQPLYTGSIGRWKNYPEAMEPEMPGLAPWVEYFGYAAH